MDKAGFLEALAGALRDLPAEERSSALKYYEDYFEDAGPLREQAVLEELGSPEEIARDILHDYKGLAVHPAYAGRGPSDDPAQALEVRKPKRGISPGLLIVLLLLAIPVGIPLLTGALALVGGLLAMMIGLVLAPIILCVVGAVLACVAVATLLSHPASAIYLLGGALVCIALGVLLSVGVFKLLTAVLPPLVRRLVALCRRPFERGRQA